jgi:hypothetical protein
MPKPQRLAALAVGELCRLLERAGGREVSEARVRADLEAGAPANPDGTIHLVHYAAWLARELARGG